jgi:hypothetical protein
MAFTRLASNSKMERVHIGNRHPKVSVAIEAHIGNGARIKTVANTMGSGVNTFSVTYVDGPATAQVRFVRTGHAESAILRRLTPVVSIEGYPMCRSVLVNHCSLLLSAIKYCFPHHTFNALFLASRED